MLDSFGPSRARLNAFVLQAICLVVAINGLSPVVHAFQQPATIPPSVSVAPPLLKNLKERTDELNFDKLLKLSTIECEKFRRSLLVPQDESITKARAIAKACVEFRKLINNRKSESKLKDSYDLSRFSLTEQQLVDAIDGIGDVSDPNGFYGSFEGKWYGLWDGNPVDHHWGGYQDLATPKKFDIENEDGVHLVGYQYAWVGDGYGVNHIATSVDGSKKFLLGYVVHVRDEDPLKEFARRPHVGVIDGPDRLIWITKAGVYLEETIRGSSRDEDRYYITGFRYSYEKPKTDKSASNQKQLGDFVAGQAFQVVYSRSESGREPWQGFEIKMRFGTNK